MAIDKKSQHVGNHGGVYTDKDGMTKQFTIIDHDRHTSRLKSWKGADHRPQEETPEDLLIKNIMISGMNSDNLFIQLYDGEMATKYGFRRYRKGTTVESLKPSDTDTKEEWYKDLKDIFKKAIEAKIKQLKEYANGKV